MDKGFIILHRALLDNPIWFRSTPEHKAILITLFLLASHTNSKWEWMGEKFEIKPGQFVTSLESIRKKTGKGISIQNVRSCLKRFQKLQFLTYKATKVGRLITIINWDSYQSKGKKATKEATKDQQRTNTFQEGKELTTNISKDISPHIKKPKIKKERKKMPEDVIEFCEKFIEYISELNPEREKADLYQSALVIDRLVRINKYPLDYIRKVLFWASKDDFWYNKIYSPATLRTRSRNGSLKFENIVSAFEGSNKKKKPYKKISRPDSNIINAMEFISEASNG